jgi:hypothetical protein
VVHDVVEDSQYIDDVKVGFDRGERLKLAKDVAFEQRYIVPKGGIRIIGKLSQILFTGFNANDFTGSGRGSGVTPPPVITCKVEHAGLFEILNKWRDDKSMPEIQPVDKSVTVTRPT